MLLDKLENVCSIVLKCFDYKSVCNVVMVPLKLGHMLIPLSYRCLGDATRVQELFSVVSEVLVVSEVPVLTGSQNYISFAVSRQNPNSISVVPFAKGSLPFR